MGNSIIISRLLILVRDPENVPFKVPHGFGAVITKSVGKSVDFAIRKTFTCELASAENPV